MLKDISCITLSLYGESLKQCRLYSTSFSDHPLLCSGNSGCTGGKCSDSLFAIISSMCVVILSVMIMIIVKNYVFIMRYDVDIGQQLHLEHQ